VVSLKLGLFLPLGKESACLSNGWLGVLQKLFRSLGENFIPFPLPEIEEQLLGIFSL
jgi:hypothetical protein